ncbi:MAG: S1C family serine protease [Candidatus Wallacebacter cryptica]|nr:trypsin-like serine protease [Bacillota bacterium]
MVKKAAVVFLLVVSIVSFGWLLRQPAQIPIEDGVESQEQRGNWEEPVVRVVQNVGPATVKIETSAKVVVDQFFFQTLEEQQGIGSGVIYRADGYILTNHHVVADADQITVRLQDGRSFTAEIVGSDELSDLAVLKIEAQDLPVVSLGNSNEIRVGQQVIAIGNPLGQDNTVTNGVVSAVNRDLLVDPENNRYLEGMIQTDAAINPGNSGGPLVDLNSQVIGINTAIIAQAQGIGFAIPSSSAKLIADQIIEHGKPLRLGVLGGSLFPALAETIRDQTDVKIAVERGAFITRVISDSPADKAGLRAGDIIVAVNGQEIAGMRELRDAVQNTGFGGILQLEYYRGEERQQAEVRL